MISFEWNGANFTLTDIGGGTLNSSIPRHAHSKNSYELHFITRGHGRLITDTDEYELAEGDFFITGPNIYHEQPKSDMDDIFITLQLTDMRRANAIACVFIETHFCHLRGFDFSTAAEILSEYRTKALDYATIAAALSAKLLTQIIRGFMPDIFEKNTSPANLNERRYVLIEQAFLFEKKLTLTALSEKIGLCPRQTERVLKKYYGKTFREKKKEAAVQAP